MRTNIYDEKNDVVNPNELFQKCFHTAKFRKNDLCSPVNIIAITNILFNI